MCVPVLKDYVIHMIHMAFRPEGHVLMPAYKKKYRVNKQAVAAEWVVSKGYLLSLIVHLYKWFLHGIS